MATNSERGNPIAASDAPRPDATPPPVSDETKQAVHSSAGAGLHAGGQDSGAAPAGPAKVKSAKELEKERKKAEKQAKFEQKKAAQAAAQSAGAAGASKAKEKKAKPAPKEEEVLPDYVEETPKGEKKRLRPLDDPWYKAYNPVAVESAWYEYWEKSGFFKPQFTPDGKAKGDPFVIVHPPPNVTGNLHMGHALGDSLQDILIRWNRMQGKTVAWIPGCDHAGIATQSVVEKVLWRRQQKTRHDLGRAEFIKTVWDWKEDYHVRINNALRKLGGSFDWSREAFTMDESRSAAVTETFVKLHEEGIIYRANRLVNWCTHLNTALSNVEVDKKELSGRTLLDVPGYDRKVEFGVLVHFKYPIEDSEETIEVATTRIETMLGDTGIAVSPGDERYAHLVGKRAKHPFIPGRFLKIVADDSVERDFGTGAVKITPAHDADDYARGERHSLEFINILTDDGLMNANAGSYEGQKRFDVRYTIQEDLKKLGLYVDKKDNPMQVPMCSRSKDIIEPSMKPQWYVRIREMADEAVKAVKDGKITIRPESAEKGFYRWMEGINDWCISRQLWWGHQCPVYFAKVEGEEADRGNNSLWFSGRTEEEAQKKAKVALSGKKFVLERDPDVLDTWFSSGLWPFSTLGWPKSTSDMETLFPTSLLETGWDILTFWVSRMIMLSLKMTGKVPFHEVFCHSLVRDSEGRKMSKSLGNVIDPLDIIRGIKLEQLHDKLVEGNLDPKEVERATKYQKSAFPDGVPECGSDALRMALAAYTTGGGDIAFDIKVLHAYRKFANKIFQATKYVLGKLPADFVPQKTDKLTGKESLAERWILHKMTTTAKELNELLVEREFSRSAQTIYAYWYGQLCDVFIENSKALIQDGSEEEKRSAIQTLYTALDAALTMIHPFMPFVTEELWQRLPRREGDKTETIMLAKYPTYDPELADEAAEAAYELVMGCSRGIRSLMAEYSLKDEAKVYVQSYDATSHKTIEEQVQSIKSLSGKGVTAIEVLSPDQGRPAGCVAYPVSSGAAAYLLVKGRVDLDAEIDKASKKLERARGAIAKQRKVMDDPTYQSKSSAATQDEARRRLDDLESEARGFEGTIKQFTELKLE